MNRRDFIRIIAPFTILPPATTYGRIWRAARIPVPAKDSIRESQWYRFNMHCSPDGKMWVKELSFFPLLLGGMKCKIRYLPWKPELTEIPRPKNLPFTWHEEIDQSCDIFEITTPNR